MIFPIFLFLILVTILVLVAKEVTNYRDVWGCSLFLQLVMFMLGPGDGGQWTRHVAFMFATLDAFGWLLRNDLRHSTEQKTGVGWSLRLSILMAPIVIAFAYSVVSEVFRHVGR